MDVMDKVNLFLEELDKRDMSVQAGQSGRFAIEVAFCDLAELKSTPYLDKVERCVMCDDPIPEGRQLCPTCERGETSENE